MAKGPKFQFKIPSPGGLNAPVRKNLHNYNPMGEKPTDSNQKAPDNANPVPQHYRLAGG